MTRLEILGKILGLALVTLFIGSILFYMASEFIEIPPSLPIAIAMSSLFVGVICLLLIALIEHIKILVEEAKELKK